MLSMLRRIGTMWPMRMRVAQSDWWASRSEVSVMAMRRAFIGRPFC